MKNDWIQKPGGETIGQAIRTLASMIIMFCAIYACLIVATNHMPPSQAEVAASQHAAHHVHMAER